LYRVPKLKKLLIVFGSCCCLTKFVILKIIILWGGIMKVVIKFSISILIVSTNIHQNYLAAMGIATRLENLSQRLETLTKAIQQNKPSQTAKQEIPTAPPSKFPNAQALMEDIVQKLNLSKKIFIETRGLYTFYENPEFWMVGALFSDISTEQLLKYDTFMYQSKKEAAGRELTIEARHSLQKIAKQLISNYKIHLMPKNQDDLYTLMTEILRELSSKPELQQSLRAIKINNSMQVEKSRSGDNLPIVVIYAADAKAAKSWLKFLCDKFGTMRGLDITPRFNKKITSLIYYAQGDGDDKNYPDLKNYFEADLVHYKPDAFAEVGVRPESGTYHLTVPPCGT
jgi:hypothetical protein